MDVRILILPFKSWLDDARLNLLMRGFEYDLTNNLSRFSGLAIISPESSLRALAQKDNGLTGELNADYLINGLFRPYQEKVKFGIQLTRASDSKIIFSHDYTESKETLADIQEDITQQIVNILQQQIDFDLLSFSYKKNKVQLAAYENYLLGMETLKKGGLEHDEEARKYFRAALDIAPGYARAYTGISLSYFNEWSCQLWHRWDLAKNGAQEYALKALEFDEQDHVALAVAGRVLLYSEEYTKAEHYLRKSLLLNPNDADNLILVAFSMLFLDKPDEAVELYKRARKLNPYHKDVYFAYGSNIYFELGDFKTAIELAEKVDYKNLWVDFPIYLAAAYLHLGDYEMANVHWQEYLSQYSKKIAGVAEANELDALEWQIAVNPYKGHTFLKDFWDYMKSMLQNGNKQTAIPVAPENVIPTAQFIKKGSFWEIAYMDTTILVKDAKGLKNIALLLQQPGNAVHCAELMGGTAINEKGVELIDRQAKNEYLQRIKAIQAELAEAENHGDYRSTEKLHHEYDALLSHLSGSLGLGNRARLSNGSADKARAAVTLRIKGVIKKIRDTHPRLADHFEASLKTGTFCSYKPEVKVSWEVSAHA